MKVLFRVDAGLHIGSGHLYRTLSIAEKLKCEVCFVVNDHIGANYEIIPSKYKVYSMKSGYTKIDESILKDYTKWSSLHYLKEVEYINEVINKEMVDVCVIDHYGLGREVEEKLKVNKIVVIDDIYNRKHCADIIINSSLNHSHEEYIKLNSKKFRYYGGPNYAFVRDEVFNESLKVKELKYPVKTIGVYYGNGPVAERELHNFLKAFVTSNLNLKVFVIRAPEAIELEFQSDERINFISNVICMGKFLLGVDCFFGGGGTMVWERSLFKIPTFLTPVAENQIEQVKSLGDIEAGFIVAEYMKSTAKDYERAFSYIFNKELLKEFSVKSYDLVKFYEKDKVEKIFLGNYCDA